MSYETNPTLNRIKIIKGWKNSTFPTKTLNYSREMILWFKVYLFLKVYLWCQKIRLLTCEIRMTEFHNKILYLSISKHIPPKKNIKSKWKTKSFLQNLKSPLTKTKNKKARFLLYQDLQTLKKKSEFLFNLNLKKQNSRAWFAKPRPSAWLNFAHLIATRRKFHVRQQSCSWKKKKKMLIQPQRFLWKSKKKPIFTTARKKIKFFNQTQKNLVRLLFKCKKDLFFLEKMLYLISSQKVSLPQKAFYFLSQQLTKQYQKLNLFLEQLQKIYQFWNQIKEQKQTLKGSLFFSKPFMIKLSLKKTKKQVHESWLYLKKKSTSFQKRQFFIFSKKRRVGFIINKNFIFFENPKEKKKLLGLSGDGNRLAQIKTNLWVRNFRSRMLVLPKIRAFKKPTRFRGIKIFKFLRFAQKKNIYKRDKLKLERKKKLLKKTRLVLKTKKNKTLLNFLSKAKKINKKLPLNLKNKRFAYRLSFRYNYKNHLILKTNLKLKYLIEDLLQQYFSLVLCVKLFWPLAQFKNVKFYRLIFPAYKEHKLKKKSRPLTLNKNLRQQKKKYLYLGQNTNHLKLHYTLRQTEKKNGLYRKISRKKRGLLLLTQNNKKQINLAHLWKKKLEKKNKYLSLKTKIIQSQSEKRLFSMSKQRFILNLITTLTLFVKYLEPQPLADHLAKIIGETKKHAIILKIIKTVLRTLHFKRGLGYRIALSGRINGTNKSRTFYLKKLNRNRPRQTFSKNVNFAMAQARATIGAFGIKIWVYS